MKMTLVYLLFLTSIYAQSSPLGVPDISIFPFSKTFYNMPDNDYTYSMYWNIIDAGTRNESLEGMLTLSASGNAPMNRSWLAIGFGSTMLNAEFIVCHADKSNSTIQLHEHFSMEIYAPPVKF